jgi:head-tail adaptor
LRPVDSKSAGGDPLLDWEEDGYFFGELVDLRGSESIRADRTKARSPVRIFARSGVALTQRHRLRNQTTRVVYEISSIQSDPVAGKVTIDADEVE